MDRDRADIGLIRGTKIAIADAQHHLQDVGTILRGPVGGRGGTHPE